MSRDCPVFQLILEYSASFQSKTSNGRHLRDLSDPYRKVVSCGPIRLSRSLVSSVGKPESGNIPTDCPPAERCDVIGRGRLLVGGKAVSCVGGACWEYSMTFSDWWIWYRGGGAEKCFFLYLYFPLSRSRSFLPPCILCSCSRPPSVGFGHCCQDSEEKSKARRPSSICKIPPIS